MGIADLQIELEQLLRGHSANDDEVQTISELTKGYVERMNILNFLKKKPQATMQEVIEIAKLFHMTEEFVLSLEEYPPNFRKAKELLGKGVDINFEGYDDEPLISDLIMGYPVQKAMNPCMICEEYDRCDDNSCAKTKEAYDSKYLPDVIRFFLECGYDVTKGEGRFGAEALHALCWSTYDKTMLEAAKILLSAGADPRYPVADGEDVFASINWKLCGCIPVDEDLEMECLYTAYYDIAEGKAKGLDFNKIQWWDAVVGKQIDKVISCAASQEEAVFEFTTGGHQYSDCFKSDLALVCEGITLIVTHYCHAYVNPCKVPDKPLDLQQKLGALIGCRITDIQFSLRHAVRGNTGRHGSTLKILLDNGKTFIVRDNGDQFDEEYCAWFSIE